MDVVAFCFGGSLDRDFLVTVFLVYALEVGLIVKHAVVATVLFAVMFLPGMFGIMYFLHWLTTDAVAA